MPFERLKPQRFLSQLEVERLVDAMPEQYSPMCWSAPANGHADLHLIRFLKSYLEIRKL